jgi:hypothetical protein
MKKIQLLGIFLLIFLFSYCCVCAGCSDDGGTTSEPGPPVNVPLENLFIQNLVPDKMPSGDSTFTVGVTSENINIDSLPVQLTISVYQTQTCIAKTVESNINGHNDITTGFVFNTANFQGCSYDNTVYKILLKSPNYPDIGDSTYYVRGNPTIQTKYVDLEKAAMPEINLNMRDSIVSGVDSTFWKYTDSNSVNVLTSWSSWNNSSNLKDTTFPVELTFNDFQRRLNDYAQAIRASATSNLLILADSQSMFISPANYVTGISNNSKYDPNYKNWAFVFMRNLASLYSNNTTIFKRTIYTFTTVHELVHQLGNIFSDTTIIDYHNEEHWNHTGIFKNRCVLQKNGSFLVNNPGAFTRNTGFFRICNGHTFKLRANIGGIPPLAFQDNKYNLLNSAGFSDGNYELQISVPKLSYKVFEPVMLNIQLINHDDTPLELWGQFLPLLNLTQVTITDVYGKTNKINHSPWASIDFEMIAPNYIINPHDTLIVTMAINDWGWKSKKVSENDNGVYFDGFGYFPAGKYKVSINAKVKYNPYTEPEKVIEVNSNEVKFEVYENTLTDKHILKLFKEGESGNGDLKPFEEVITNYPENPFTEHIFIDYLFVKYAREYKNSDYKYINLLENEYEEFISKYPNSEYLVDERFIAPYIYKYFMDIYTNNLKKSFNTIYDEFTSQNQDNMLKYFLKDKKRIKLVLGLENY